MLLYGQCCVYERLAYAYCSDFGAGAFAGCFDAGFLPVGAGFFAAGLEGRFATFFRAVGFCAAGAFSCAAASRSSTSDS